MHGTSIHFIGPLQSLIIMSDNLPCIMVAGKPRNGKSRALNNIFEVDFESATSPGSVTQSVLEKHVEKDGKKMVVIDTPGLGALDMDRDTSKLVQEMKEAVEGLDYVLLYCLSVAPNSSLTLVDQTIIKCLHESLGMEAWKNCVILLTFSDIARVMDYRTDSKVEEFKVFLKNHAARFQELIQSCIDEESSSSHAEKEPFEIKTIFEITSGISEELETEGKSEKEKESEEEKKAKGVQIVAIPVGRDIPSDPCLLPGILKEKENWTDAVFLQLMEKVNEEKRAEYVQFKYDREIRGLLLAGLGTGAATGALMGAVAGPPGALVGAIAGAVVGGIISIPVIRLFIGKLRKEE